MFILIDRLVFVVVGSSASVHSLVHTVDRKIVFNSWLLHNTWLQCGDHGIWIHRRNNNGTATMKPVMEFPC